MTKTIIVGCAMLAACAPLFAHHGTAASYDEKKVLKITGVVQEFMWRNPHSGLFINGKDESGKVVSFSVEMGSPNAMAKQGLRRDTFKPGDNVVIEVHPSFTNPTSGVCLSCNASVNGKPLTGLAAR